VVFVIADGIGANLERAGMLSGAGHGALMSLAGLLCSVSIGLRTIKDKKPFRRLISSFVFGMLFGLYVFGLTFFEYEPPTVYGLMGISMVLCGLASTAVSTLSVKVSRRVSFFK
jgi:hypothetical protein